MGTATMDCNNSKYQAESELPRAGVFHFAPPLAARGSDGQQEAPAGGSRHRMSFQGMFNGRPCGRGVTYWSDGARVRVLIGLQAASCGLHIHGCRMET